MENDLARFEILKEIVDVEVHSLLEDFKGRVRGLPEPLRISLAKSTRQEMDAIIIEAQMHPNLFPTSFEPAPKRDHGLKLDTE